MARHVAYIYRMVPLSERLASIRAYQAEDGWHAVADSGLCKVVSTSAYPTKEEALAELGVTEEVAPHPVVLRRRPRREA